MLLMADNMQLPHPAIKYFATFLYLLISLAGLVFNLLWVIIIYLNRRHLQRSFYIISQHLLIADILCVLAQLAVAIPVTFMDYKMSLFFRRTAFFNYFAIFETVGRFATLIFIFLQALSQAVIFMPNSRNLANRLHACITSICLLGWAFNIGLLLWFSMAKCRKDFSSVYYNFFCDCSQNKEMAKIMWTFISIFTIIIIVVGLCIYGFGLQVLKKSLKTSKGMISAEMIEKRELGELMRTRLILLQGMLIIQVTIAQTLSSFFISILSQNLAVDSYSILNIVVNLMNLLSSSVHPLIYIAIDDKAFKKARNVVRVVLCQTASTKQVEGIMVDCNSGIFKVS